MAPRRRHGASGCARSACVRLARLCGRAHHPKTIAFFTAFLPQFIDPALPAERQLLVMCAVSVVLAGLLDAAWAVAAGYGRALLMKPRQNTWLGRISGLVLIGGGLWLSLQRRPG